MPSSPKNYPFYNWVPKPVGIIILFVFFLPILTVGGTYSVASTEMMSGLGIISEHIQFANFATSIGMAAFCPFLYRLVVIRRQKMMCLAGFSLMYIFSYICAKTDSVFLLALCSIFMGFLRMVLMMVNLFTRQRACNRRRLGQAGHRTECGTTCHLPILHGTGTIGNLAHRLARL